jgi:isopenicillin N synthase-like dioxygenase
VEWHTKFTELALLIQDILNECMGLPTGFLREYNDDRTFDFMSVRHCFPATKEENKGVRPHQDVSCISFVLQDGVGGLEVVGPDGGWAPVEPVEGSIVVNIGEVVQVLTNDKFRSAMHRVVRNPAAHRYSLVFFLNVHGDKWVEPLPQFATDVGEAPRYRGFKYGEYLKLRARDTKAYQLSKAEDVVDITHYAI